MDLRPRVDCIRSRIVASWRAMESKAMRLGVAYAMLATIASALAIALRDGMPWIHPAPWLILNARTAHLASAALGVGAAFIIISATRLAVFEFAWARRLHRDLRPIARDLSRGAILAIAIFSSVGEELFFRGLVVPTVGLWLGSVVFGLAHQIRGPSRVIWIVWASIVGLGFGAIFQLTGSLVGPILAHGLTNAFNLVYLRDHDVDEEG
jgi:membrane protease YdiL (CAAX protease family)